MTNASERLGLTGNQDRQENRAGDMSRGPLFVGSVEKAFSVLAAFKRAKSPLSLSEIATATGLGKSATQRFCYTLVELGFLERGDNSRRMSPAARLLELSYSYLSSDPVSATAAPYLLKARDACGEAMNLGIPVDQRMIYISRLRSARSHLINPIVGGGAPMFCTSSGRAYLSTLAPEVVTAILDKTDFTPLTPHTITDRNQVVAQIDLARTRGYALASQECILRELTVGAPIYGNGNNAVGAINICVSMPTWSIELVEADLVPLVTQTAHEISLALAG